jgi:hypothetical protein
VSRDSERSAPQGVADDQGKSSGPQGRAGRNGPTLWLGLSRLDEDDPEGPGAAPVAPENQQLGHLAVGTSVSALGRDIVAGFAATQESGAFGRTGPGHHRYASDEDRSRLRASRVQKPHLDPLNRKE